MAGKMSESLNIGWRWDCQVASRPTAQGLQVLRRRIYVFKEYKNADGDRILGGHANGSVSFQIASREGSGQGADLCRALYRRHLHQAIDSNPPHIP